MQTKEEKASRIKIWRELAVKRGICSSCGREPAKDGCVQCVKCIQRSSKTTKLFRQKMKTAGLCTRCGINILKSTTFCLECLQKQHANNLALKLEVFTTYGGCKCSCSGCNTSHHAFLGIDHIDGGGKIHREKVGGGSRFYVWLKKNKYPAGFRVLCHNCNLGRQINGGICPHLGDS